MAVIEKSTAKERVLFKHWLKGYEYGAAAWIKFVNRFLDAGNESLFQEIGSASIEKYLPTVKAENFLTSAFIFGEVGSDEFDYWSRLHRDWQENLSKFRALEKGKPSC